MKICCCCHRLAPPLQVLVDSVTILGFDDLMVSECMRLLEDDEVRVRLAVGQLLRSLATKHGLSVLQTCQDTVLNSIHTHFVSAGTKSEGGGCHRTLLVQCPACSAAAAAAAVACCYVIHWHSSVQ